MGSEVALRRVGQLIFKAVEREAQAKEHAKRRYFWSFSRSDAGGLIFSYVVSFLICRFDISRHHAFENPMPTQKAALIAIPLAIVVAVVEKIRGR